MFNAGSETVSQTIRRLMDGGYTRIAGRVLDGVARSVNGDGSIIQVRLAELETEALRLAEDGKRLRPDNAVLRALTADLETVMGRNAGRVDGIADDLIFDSVQNAGTITRQLALPNFDPVALKAAGIGWNEPDGEAVARLVSYVDTPAWGDELARMGVSVPERVRDQVIGGFAQGFSPARMSRLIRDTVQTMPRYEADRLARTVQLQSYRSATAVHQNANVGIIDRVIRIAALDARTCLACISLSGTVIWDKAKDLGTPITRIDEHHFGRCTTVTEVAGITRNIQTGEDWFGGLSEAQQRTQMGHANYEAWTSGAVSLNDFVAVRDDDVFGPMIVQASLKGILGDEAKEYYQ